MLMCQGSLDFFSSMLIQLLEIRMQIKVLPDGSLQISPDLQSLQIGLTALVTQLHLNVTQCTHQQISLLLLDFWVDFSFNTKHLMPGYWSHVRKKTMLTTELELTIPCGKVKTGARGRHT